MADPVTNGVKNISMQDPKQVQGQIDSDVIDSAMDTMNGLGNGSIEPTQLTFEQGQGEGRDVTSPHSQDHGDSKYEFDPVSTGSSSAPLSPPETTDSSSGMFVDFDGVTRQLHEASTASVSPQSPPEGAGAADPFSHENKENSDPMTSSFYGGDPMTSSMIEGDLMTSSFVGDYLPESSRILNTEVSMGVDSSVVDDITGSVLPPGGPVSDAALQEIGVYGAPPPEEEGGSQVAAPISDLVCLDEDGMEMPTTQAPTAPPSNSITSNGGFPSNGGLPSNAFPSNPVSDSLINTQAPMGQFDPFKVNGSQSAGGGLDGIPGQPPIGFTPPLQPKQAFVDPAPLVPDVTMSSGAESLFSSSSAAPGGPVAPASEGRVTEAPPFGMPPRNEPLFTQQPLPDVADVKVTSGAGGQGQNAMFLEDLMSENGPTVPPIDLSGFDRNEPEVKDIGSISKKHKSPEKPESPKKPQSPKKSEPAFDSSKIPSPKKAKPASAATTTSATAKQTSASPRSTAAKTTTAVKQTNSAKTTSNNKAPAKKLSPTSATANKTAPAKTSPRAASAASSPRTPAAKPSTAPARQSPRSAPPSRPSPRGEPIKRSPRATTKDGASDSGIEDEKASPRKGIPTTTKTPPKKYGTNSVANLRHKPGGGNVKIFSEKVTPKNVAPKTDCKASPRKVMSPRTPRTPPVKTTPSPNTRSVTSKVGSTANLRHTPGGGNVKISHQKQDLSTVRSKCGTMDNVKHTPRGGEKKIESKKLEWKAESKVGSKDNIKHQAGGGDKRIESVKLDFKDKAASKVGSKDNIKHQAGGGEKKIENKKLDWKAESKVGSMDYVHHQAGGGDKEIETHKLEFREKAASKVGSKDNIKHQPGGGDKQIETRKLEFREKAQPRTDTGFVSGAGSQYTGSDRGESPVPEETEPSPEAADPAPGE